MKVTNIKQQIKNQERYSIYVDGKFSFGLGELGLMNSGLQVGKQLSPRELNQLKDSARDDKAYGQVLNLITRRPRSEWEVRDYLKRKEYDPELINRLVQRLYGGQWLNDLEFARRWVENRRLLKNSSQRRLQQELKAKRVSDDVIRQALEEDEADEKQVLADLVVRKRKQTRYRDDQKLMAYLMRQGYNYGDVKDALSLPELD